MLNNQQYITTELEKILYEILPITSKRLKNIVHIIIGIILSKLVVISDISEKLKDNFTEATEESKIKRIYTFFSSSIINPEYIYSFLILKFSLKVGKRAIPLWYKIFDYHEKENKSFEHVKEGIRELNDIFISYNY